MKTNSEFVSFLIHLAEEERGVDIEVLGNLLGVDLEQPALDASILHKGLCRWTKDGIFVDRDYIHLVLAEVDEVRPKVLRRTMICSVCYKWLDNGDWSPTFTRYINIKDGNLKRAARVVAKEFGKLKGSFNIEDDEIDFRVDDGEVLYWVCIRPLIIEDV